ncbi:CHAT domain-containing protein [Tunicatimonas pelagia]|uniref:CHAT domain-containing protein n=1 Tax=Tunicatimonas pelagia TaxID=931531 RepID=UPI0026669322|nr:CHAT domain-containing tetratricopeptide repeat protein [Tunicatimonas pelagia]WKN42017.1 CHAT domain-containing protein [Tunicatimonas pelagia]
MQYFLYPVDVQAQTLTPSQQDSLVQEIEATIYSVYEQYFYTQPDSTFRILETVAQQAETYQLWDIQITSLLQAAWCAEYHTQIDTLQQYLNRIEALTHQHVVALDTLDASGEIRTNVAYTRGSFYYNIGDFTSAIHAFNEIVQPQALVQINDSLLVADVFTYLASSYYRLQNYQKSLTHYRIVDQWLPATSEAPNYQLGYRKTLNGLHQARCYFTIGKYNHQPAAYERGKRLAHQSLAFFNRQKSDARFYNPIRSAINILVSVFQEQQQYDSALHYLSQSLALSSDGSELLLNTYNTLGATYTLMQDYPKALKSYQKSEALADKLLPKKHYQRAAIYTRVGQVLAAQHRWSDALEKYQQALAQLVVEFNASSDILTNPVYRDVGARKELLEVLSYKAEALWGLYQQQPQETTSLQSALEIYHLIGNILDEMRQGFPSVEFKQFIASHFFGIYEQAIRIAYEMHQRQPASGQFLAQAFHFAEKSKSFILLEATQETQAQSFGGIPDSLLEQERTYTRRLSILEQQRDGIADSNSQEAVQLEQQLLITQDARQKLLQQFEQNYPEYYALRHNTNVASLADVQASLPANTVLLSYYLGDSSLFAFGISPNKIVIDSIANLTALGQDVDHLLTFVRQYDWEAIKDSENSQQWAKSGHTLYQQLIGGVLDSLGSKPEKLVIIPDGQLGYLSFDVLLTEPVPETMSTKFGSFPYLIKELPLRYEYSASLYVRQPSPENTISNQYAYTGFAPEYKNTPLLAENTVTRSGAGTEVFYDLLYNKEEVQQVSGLFNSQIFLDDQATEQAFREFAPRSSLLHLSMHAFAHDQDPMYSGLVFSQADTTTEDNFLYAHELYALQLRSNLAVLSACETGIGQLARGEGIMSLGRAFKYAGCPNVAMSLWKVNDRTTQRIVQSFFEQLADGADKDIALQQAKLAFLAKAKGPLAHPYYWASLVLIGDDLPLTTSPFPYTIFIGLALLLLVSIIVLIKKRRKTT